MIKYAMEERHNPDWPYWIVEKNINPVMVPQEWQCEMVIGEDSEIVYIKSPNYRTVPVTEEYYKLIATKGKKIL